MKEQAPLTTTDLVALWGAFTGTISLALTFLSYIKDKAIIGISISADMKVMNSNVYDSNRTYISISVHNKGRRPVIISKVGYVYLKNKGGAILSDSFLKVDRKLTEGMATDFLAIQEGIDLKNISYFAAYDAVGNVYKKYWAPFYKIFFYWFCNLTGLRNKEYIKTK